MSRRSIQPVIDAFLNGEAKRISNTESTGSELLLFGHCIAKRDETGSLMITNAGWSTYTTKDRLNGLPAVSVTQRDFTWYLNGKQWDGAWVKVEDWL